ncbi:acyl-CoA dehydrogenase family protein [Pseudomonas sp. NPDC012596]|uniref:acyl-CoA dehydrogenase family protein n=1 Tax=Pseudomonas sp. NPDC012596 TaxID=3364419 RepID=UPI0036A4EC28
MFLHLSEEEQLYRDAVEGTIKRVAPVEHVQKLDNAKMFDFELHKALAELGVWGVGIEEECGGAGGTPKLQVLTLETLGRMATSMAVFGVVQFMATRLLRQYGTPQQQDRYLARLCAGEIKASFCLTEESGGTDILQTMRTKAKRVDEGWRLIGSKYWISGAMHADLLIVLARTSDHRSRGVTMFLVDKTAPGVSATEINTFAINSYDTCSVAFDDVSLAETAVLGEVDQGFIQVLNTLNSERLNAAAVATGIGRGAQQLAVEYAKDREAFGRPIGQFQALQHRLVHAGVALEQAWLTTQMAAIAEEQGHANIEVPSAIAKLAANKAANDAVRVGMEAMGGAGFDLEYPMQRYYRDIRLYSFAPLTDDMLANLLGERWLELPRSF